MNRVRQWLACVGAAAGDWWALWPLRPAAATTHTGHDDRRRLLPAPRLPMSRVDWWLNGNVSCLRLRLLYLLQTDLSRRVTLPHHRRYHSSLCTQLMLGLSSNNKWRWGMWTAAATGGLDWLGLGSSGALSASIKWTAYIDEHMCVLTMTPVKLRGWLRKTSVSTCDWQIRHLCSEKPLPFVR